MIYTVFKHIYEFRLKTKLYSAHRVFWCHFVVLKIWQYGCSATNDHVTSGDLGFSPFLQSNTNASFAYCVQMNRYLKYHCFYN